MPELEEIKQVKKGKANYVYSIIGVALVLFLMGILGWIVIYASELTKYFKENIEIQVIFNDATRDEKALQLKKIIASQDFVKSCTYVSKDEAARLYGNEHGNQFMDVLQYNPLYSSVNVHLKNEYVNKDSLIKIKRFLGQSNIVREVFFEQNLVDAVVNNVRKVTIALSVLAFLLIFAVIFLIDNTIRLAMFSNRFLIKTMQMVGATRNFITRPFSQKSIINGIISAFIAIVLLLLVKSVFESWVPEIKTLSNNYRLTILCLVILLLGILISYFSTRRSVTKYLKTQLDELY